MTMLDYLTAAKKAIAAITNTKAVKAQRTEAFIEAYSYSLFHTSIKNSMSSLKDSNLPMKS
jgi:hypothetical protein